ncbi:MAG: hypothetical protein HY648_02040 [Acidobacteria bacterium]|nr:hypothetical protein [Acidobacteriota bacterium]
MGQGLRKIRRVVRRFPAKRAIAFTVAVLFCFHLVRFYQMIPLELFECFDHDLEKSAAVAGSQSHSHSHKTLSSPTGDAGYTLEHCKDTYNGIGLIPAQPMGLPVAVSQEFQELASLASFGEPCQPQDLFLSPPFEPPRQLI